MDVTTLESVYVCVAVAASGAVVTVAVAAIAIGNEILSF